MDTQTTTFRWTVYQNATWETITDILYSHIHVTLSTLPLKQQHQVSTGKPNFNSVSSLWLACFTLKEGKIPSAWIQKCFLVHCMFLFVTFFFCHHYLNLWSQYYIQYIPYVKSPFQTQGITLSGTERPLIDWMDLQAHSIPFKKHSSNSWVVQAASSTEGFRGSVLRFFHQPNTSDPGVFKRMPSKCKL